MNSPVVLVALVGLTPDPLLVSLARHEPVYTVFIHSRESERTLDGPAGVIQKAGVLSERSGKGGKAYEKLPLADPDNPRAIYDAMVKLIARLKEQFPGSRVLVDFSSGTTSMAGAAPLAAVDAGATPVFVRGLRRADGTITPGTEVIMRMDPTPMQTERLMALVKRSWAAFDYTAAEQALLEILRRKHDPYTQTLLTAARGLMAWDMMELESARNLLSHVGSYMGRPRMEFLARGAADMRRLAKLLAGAPPVPPGSSKKPAVSYALVHHLVLNARRRAARGRYADGLARLYRAVELYAQITLISMDPPVSTSNVDLTILGRKEAAIFERFRGDDGKVRIGLRYAYMLLGMLGHPLKDVHRRWEKRLNAALEKRNQSILAHGLASVTKDKFHTAHGVITAFINDADATLGRHPFDKRLQFPAELPPNPAAPGAY